MSSLLATYFGRPHSASPVINWHGMPAVDSGAPALLRFSVFEVDLASGELRKRGVRIKLQGQPFRVLALLLRRPGEIVTREALYDEVWSSRGTFVEFEHGLNASIAKLRQALADSADNPRFIETVPRRGYRFIAPVEVAARAESAPGENQGAPANPRTVIAALVQNRRGGLLAMAAIAALILGAVAVLAPHNRVAPVPAVVSLTTDQGSVGMPTFSPDGNEVAYVWDGEKHNNLDIYVKAIGSQSALRLTTNPADDVQPAWSPEGRQIAFVRGTEIYTISPFGGPERKLADVTEVPWSAISWSSDGKWLAVAEHLAPQEPNGLFLISADGLQRRRLTIRNEPLLDVSPAFSPDGRWLAYATCTASICIPYLMSLTSDLSAKGEPRRLDTSVLTFPSFAWSSDSQSIIFDRKLPVGGFSRSSSRLGRASVSNDRLWRISIRPGARPERLEYTDQGARCPAVSRVAGQLAYDQFGFDFDIWRWKNGKTEKLIASTALDEDAQYSPDGRRIAFASARSGTHQIWVADADGTNPIQLTFSSIWAGSPAWSPDGRWITYDDMDSTGKFTCTS